MSTQSVVIARPNDWPSRIKAQQEIIRLGQWTRLGRLDALCFELTQTSNPRMLALAKQRTPQGRAAWPGIHFDWLNQGPPIALGIGSMLVGDTPEVLLPAKPFPLPPPAPDPTWEWSEANPAPKCIPQRIEDRAMRIKGTPFRIIQPVIQIHWVLDQAAAGHARREIHNVVADSNGLHMAFIYDPEAQTGHLVNGRLL